MTGTSPTLTAHSCTRGTYYAVLVAAPGLTLDDSLARKASAGLRRIEQQLP
jgi:hypothetical protein